MLPTSSFLIYCKHIVGQMPAVSPQTQTPLLNWLTHLNFNLDRYLIKAVSILNTPLSWPVMVVLDRFTHYHNKTNSLWKKL